MVKSMTAYGRQEIRTQWGELSCELRSVNHRYLEVSTRLPEELKALEARLRELVSKQIKRGKIDCTFRFKASGERIGHLNLNEAAVTDLIDTYRQLQQRLSSDRQLNPLDVLKWPGAVVEQEQDIEQLHTAAIQLLEGALKDLIDTRQREGEKLKALILQRCEGIEAVRQSVSTDIPQIMQRLRERLQARLDELSVEPDSQRLEQELAFSTQKMDVAEELDRLKAHVEEVKAVLNRKEPIGRRLDFLMQELNREANTLGSKSYDSETTKKSVELKVLVEQMREQIQNIE
ncbi:MAG: YicC family protein [Gammaproteobacteria bacterium]|nr:YicC family protein [Gammaproteobacteria bacterium]